jgi:hypothetical protein
MQIWTRNTAFFLADCGFAIYRLGHKGNLRICGLSHLVHLRICDCGMCPGIVVFAFCRLTNKNLRAHLCTLYTVLYVRVYRRVESTMDASKKDHQISWRD